MVKESQLFRVTLIIGFQLCMVLQGYSQTEIGIRPSTEDNPINYYRQLTVAFCNPVFRDFATSPLFYDGSGIALNTGWLKRSEESERLFQLELGFNAISARVLPSDFLEPQTDGIIERTIDEIVSN